jgi:hypothetical protein
MRQQGASSVYEMVVDDGVFLRNECAGSLE